MKFYETALVLKEDPDNRNKIHKTLDRYVRDSFFKDADKALRNSQTAPKYRFISQPHPGGTLCIVRSAAPLGLPGEKTIGFSHDESKPFEFKSLMCLNKKLNGKLIYDPEKFEDVVLNHLSRIEAGESGVFVDDYSHFPINKGRDRFSLVGAWVTVSAQLTKDQAYKLMVNGIGIKGVYGFGLVIPE